MKRWMVIVMLLIVAGGLSLAGWLNHRLVERRRVIGITQADPLINAPPLVVFTTVALGGFRGMIADALWLRASRLQSEGKHFELVQLADWITKLEPRFTDVWAYHAWNLAYNISVMFSDPADRWRWVQHGISLLRDEGLFYNPEDARLQYELGWLFQHKIGANSDDAHGYYKQAWADEMQQVFPGGRPDFPALREDESHRQEIRQRYKLKVETMQAVEAEFGALDWRLPFTHAIYWATESKKSGREFDQIAAHRMIYQSMADLFRRGKIFSGSAGNRLILAPRLDLFPSVVKAFESARRYPGVAQGVDEAYRNFMTEAVILFYLYNRQPEAQSAFQALKALHPAMDPRQELTGFIFDAYTAKGPLMNREEAFAAVESALYQGLIWRQVGDGERAAGYEQMARMIWNRYMAPRFHDPALRERTGLPALVEINAQARQRFAETYRDRLD